jgi:hypothetical protein
MPIGFTTLRSRIAPSKSNVAVLDGFGDPPMPIECFEQFSLRFE